MRFDYKLLYLAVALLGAVLFIPNLGAVHLFDWDEINFAESAREMLLTGDYFKVKINFEQFWEKPPLFIWMQALSMKIFGFNEFAARFPNALVGVATLLVLFHLGKKLYDQLFGLIWAVVYAGTFLTHLYFKSGIIDPVFNLFIFIGIYHIAMFSRYRDDIHNKDKVYHSLFAGLFIGFAVLTKGPVALLVTLLSIGVYIIVNKGFKPFTIKHILLFILPFVIINFAWFGVEMIQSGPWFLKTFIEYQIRLFLIQDAGHGGPFFYHFVVLLIGCFPASIYVFKAFRKNFDDDPAQKALKMWMIILFGVVLVLFSIVQTKIVHYSSLCYFPLTFLCTDYLYRLHFGKMRFPKYFNWLILVIGTLISLLLILLPLFIINKDEILKHIVIEDVFAMANLQAQVEWTGFESLIGVFYLIVIWGVVFFLNKKEPFTGALILLTSTILVVQMTLYIVVPKIERYSQGASIDFLESLQGKDCYVEVLDYKSYAQFFYSQKPAWQRPESRDIEWLLTGPIDKPAYFITKVDRGERYPSMPELKEIGRKNGFIFYYREKVSAK
jgi:4-amino-4-deoxy-L-arabinose transferase-like glycosyltransferase